MGSRLIFGALALAAALAGVAGVAGVAGTSPASAKQMSEKERMRAQAEHVCYNDVQKLCNADIPDENKIQACMRVHRTQLSPACRKVFEASMK